MRRLLIVDDSPYYRMRFAKIFARSKHLAVAGQADDGDVAIRQILELRPDIVLLDLLMPKMDGFGVLRWAMKNHPLPIIVCSSFSDRERVFKALELGAVDFILKPTPRATQMTSRLEDQMIQRVEEAADAKAPSDVKVNPDIKVALLAAESEARGAQVELICIAASTGGPAAIQKLVAALPQSLSVPMVVVQHMPVGFTRPFAERLNAISHYTVREARDKEPIKRKHIYVAPAGAQTTVSRAEGGPSLSVTDHASKPMHTPSADALFESAAAAVGEQMLAIVLTGMGEDGARGAEAVRGAGGHVIVESNESAVVFGMPRSVIERGCANAMLPLSAMPSVLIAYTLKE
ncbi:MAG TPA: chemotaxis-specific protein-glutamate methyltransferase CheB [Blastocatellia bacterium]|nr:chemotaxis-specific protein-glutamate methyltransferase CheB [Blastocatellia bacterium]